MKEFEFFLNRGDVKKQIPDKNLSEATFKECLERLELSKGLLQKAKPKYVLENAYEAMREAADSILYLDGFKSFSHEASIVYLIKRGFNEQDVMDLDRFRKIRNGIKYYGRGCDDSDADSAIKLAEKNLSKKIKCYFFLYPNNLLYLSWFINSRINAIILISSPIKVYNNLQ